jgi:hypothetical protein
MRNLFAILLLSVPLLQTSPPPNRGKQQEATQKKHEPSSVSPAPLPVEDKGCPCKQENSSKAETEQRPQNPPWWDVAWSTWALVVVGAIAAWIAVRTLKDIRKQTRNTAIAAEAAARNAEAVVNAERAWIMTTIDNADHAHIQDTENLQTGEFTSIVHLTLNYTNVGRIPCWVTDKAVWFRIIESIPNDPVFDTPTRRFGETEPLVQGQPQFIHLSQLTSKGVHAMVLSGEGKGGNVPIFYGYIRYRDPFGSNRETRFGYMVKGHRWLRIPSENYNRNT